MTEKPEVTGELRDWTYDNRYNVIWGRIFGDTKGRFDQGERIHTSYILTAKADLKPGTVVKTLNSQYLLGEQAE